jgi:hypothetical protein
MCVKDEVETLGRVAMVKFEQTGERPSRVEGKDRGLGVARKRQIESAMGASMTAFLPSGVLVPRLREGGCGSRYSRAHWRP